MKVEMNTSGHKEHPILFSGPMVRAILEGRKTQTRRVVKWQPLNGELNWWNRSLEVGFYCTGVPTSGYVLRCRDGRGTWNDRTQPIHCPFGKPGDRLWVREAWAIKDAGRRVSLSADAWPDGWPLKRLRYIATDKPPQPDYWWNSRPSIHMPRWASRITLEITNVRVERIADISPKEVIAEGVIHSGNCNSGLAKYPEGVPEGINADRNCDCSVFRDGWDALNAKRGYGWEKNPFVWVLSFRRID